MKYKQKKILYIVAYVSLLFMVSIPLWNENNPIFMFGIQVMTIVSAAILFDYLFQEKWLTLFGVFIYMTCPYRLYICYDKTDVRRCIAWMLLPFFIKGLYQFIQNGNRWKDLLITGLFFAGIGYADNVVACIVLGIVILGAIWYRTPPILLPVGFGFILYFPSALRFMKYILLGTTEIANIPLDTIAKNGYMPGRLLTIFYYSNDLPGLGAGLFCGILIYLWLKFSGETFHKTKYSYVEFISILLLLFSMEFFPWDLVQRVGAPLLRLVALINSPNVFLGLACVALCILVTAAMEKLQKQEDRLIREGLPMITVLISIIGTITMII